MRFSFTRMTEADLGLLHRWLEAPHVRAFYDREPRTLDGVVAAYGGKVRGDEPTAPYIVRLAGARIGYLQVYRFADYPDDANAFGVSEAAAGVDMLIGEPTYARRGLGAGMLAQFLDDIVWPTTGATSCWIAPRADNAIAIHCYAKAGFTHVRTVTRSGEDRAEYVMRRER
jgi:RimJ/RimL family protein N-acetyltransferase